MSKRNKFTPKLRHVIVNPEQAKIFLHHLRMQILELLSQNAMTVTQIAKEFAVHPANLTHHVKRLEKAGLIKLVEKRDIGRTTEKYYRAIALEFELKTKKQDLNDADTVGLRILRDDLNDAINQANKDDGPTACLLCSAKMTRENFDVFKNRLTSLVEEFKQVNEDNGICYNLNLSLYPARSKRIRSTAKLK